MREAGELKTEAHWAQVMDLAPNIITFAKNRGPGPEDLVKGHQDNLLSASRKFWRTWEREAEPHQGYQRGDKSLTYSDRHAFRAGGRTVRFMAFGGHPNGRGHWGSLKAPQSHAPKKLKALDIFGLSWLTKVPEQEQWMDG